ncbi:MAG: hypothetical protein FJ221_10930 [Lentisphaerae bacterium]|nr:hypothetical protein [Lentisphaerota bacterium]
MRRIWMLAVAAWMAVEGRAATPAPRDDGVPQAVGLRLGTLGLGAEYAVGLGDYVNLRAVGHLGGFSVWGDFSDVEYDVAVDFRNIGLILDFHVAQGGFRWSAGVFYNGNEYEGTATPTANTEIGGMTFTPRQIGTIRGDADTDELAYYAGIGFGNPVSRDGRWTVTLDLGVYILASDPTMDLTADGTASSNPIFQAQLAEEADDVGDDLPRWWPVIAFGISYRF